MVLQLIDCDHAMDKNRYFAIRMNEACVGEGAKFTYCTMESTEENVFNLRRFAVSAGRNSIINMSSFGIVCGATRNHIEVDLNGEGAEVWLGGVLLGYQVIPQSFYELGYRNNGLMILPPMALIIVGVIIWIQRTRHPELQENNKK